MKGFYFFVICGFLFSLTLNILYFNKKHIKTNETKIFSRLLVVNFLSLFFELLCTYAGYFLKADSFLAHVTTKIYLIFLMTFLLYMTLYIYTICYSEGNHTNEKYYQFLTKLSYIIYFVCVLICIYLPITTSQGYASGAAVNWLYICSTLVLIEWLIPYFKNFKTINMKKAFPMIIFEVFMIIVSIIQKVYPEMTLITVMEFLVIFIMHHTIENPDLNMLNEYLKNKELVEKGIDDKANMLFQISEDVKIPAQRIEKLAKKIAENDNINEIHNDAREIISLSYDANRTVNKVLNISNYELSNIKTSELSYNIYNLFKELVIMVKEKISDNVEFKYSISGLVPERLYGDYFKIKQIIYSMLSNAIRNTNKGTIDFAVSSINRGNVSRLIVTVSDTSLGIDAYEINELLENTSELTKEEIAKVTNLDINFKLTKKICDILGGELLIKSKENEGTTITFIVSQVIDQENSNAQLKLEFTNKQKILVICDDYQELEKLTSEFRKNNYLVTSSLYGLDLVKKINNQEKYDLIFIDDEMEPNNAVEIIKKVDITNEKIIIMLNKDKATIKKHYLEDYPFVDYLLKDNYKEEIKRIRNRKW